MPKKSPDLHLGSPKNRRLIISIFGFCLGLFGLLYGIFWEVICNSLLEKAMTLRPNSQMFNMWKSPPLQLTLDMHLFNWTNPEEFGNRSIKPHFEELGPYRFTDRPDKVDIRWHPENASVTYRRKSDFFFDEAGSNGTLNDMITTLNLVAVAAASKTKHWGSVRRTFIDLALNIYQGRIPLHKTANELMFGGYDDVLLNVANFIPTSISDMFIPFDKFGYCYARNSSAQFSGIFNVHTGADDIRKIGQLHTWNYKTSTRFFPSECSQVRGSAGEFQPPNLQPSQSLNYFLPDLCRAISLDFTEATEVDGIPGLKYTGGQRSVDNGSVYPENACYCNGECVPSGLMNISSCWYGASVFMSYPHFYHADPYYLDQVDGLKPDPDRHEFHLVIEPKTGFNLELKARYQVNLLVEPMSDLNMFRDSRKIFFPLFWFEERTRITPELALKMKIILHSVLAGQIFGFLCFLIGMALFLWRPLKARYQRRLQQTLVSTERSQDKNRGLDQGDPHAVTPDHSPLLTRGKQNSQRWLLPKTLSTDSAKTMGTTCETPSQDSESSHGCCPPFD